jgi:signal transduction histidine kinase
MQHIRVSDANGKDTDGHAKAIGPLQSEPSTDPREPVLTFLVCLIRATTSCAETALFEYGRAARKRGPNIPTACSPEVVPAPQIVQALVDDPRSQSGPSECFSLGRIGRGEQSEVLGLRLSVGDDVFLRGYACFDAKPRLEDWSALRAICVNGAGLVSEIRKEKARAEAEAAGRAFQSRMFEALRLGSDAYWEADSSGVIRNVALHKIADTNLIRMLEGRNLNAIAGRPEALRAGEFRDLKLETPAVDRTGPAIELSGRALPDGSWQGIAWLAAKGRDSLTTTQARSVIEELEAARDHEAALRRETELILDGLRILTSGHSRRELFKELLDSLAPALEFQAAVILWRDWAGKIAARVGTSPELLTLDWQSVGEKLFAIDEVAVALGVPKELTLPIPGDGPNAQRSALAVKLRGGSKAAILLGLHTRPTFFGTRHLGLGTRLALIASQAFMNEEERQKVVDSSQLATIGEMAAGIVHEINQPLTAMTFAINNLKEMLESGATTDPEKLAAKLVKLQGQVDRVSKIVANMRVLARHSDGTIEPFDLSAAVEEAVGIIHHKLHKAAIELKIDIKKGLEANGNALEFSQVVLNLLSNAHDAILSSPKSEKPRRISVIGAALDLQWLEICVRDTGTGFPEEGAERAFEPFFTTKGVGKGTGLGLALCRRIVENMGGTIVLGNWEQGAEIRARLKRTGG